MTLGVADLGFPVDQALGGESGKRERRVGLGDGGSRREFKLKGGRLHGLDGCREADQREKKWGVRERNFASPHRWRRSVFAGGIGRKWVEERGGCTGRRKMELCNGENREVRGGAVQQGRCSANVGWRWTVGGGAGGDARGDAGGGAAERFGEEDDRRKVERVQWRWRRCWTAAAAAEQGRRRRR